MRHCRLLILTALKPEAVAVGKALEFERIPAPAEPAWKGEVCLGLIGLGAARLAELPRDLQPQGIMMAGLAGGLAPLLKVGDIVIDAPGDFPLGEESQRANPEIVAGRIHMSRELVGRPEQKAALYEKTGCLAVDMESDHARALAESLQVPFLVVRAISDRAGEELDPRLLSLIDDQGRPRTGRALATVARRPGSLAMLLRTKRAADLALKNLGAVVRAIVESGWPVKG